MPTAPPTFSQLKYKRGLAKRPRSEDRRATAAQRGYDYRWQKFSDWYKSHHFQCVDCGDWIRDSKDKHADHIVPLSAGGAHCDEANTQLLCSKCHGRKTRRENATGGGGC